MSLTPLTTSDISATIVAQVEASISQTIPLLPKAFTRVLAKALSGVIVLIYKYAGFIFLQLFVQYASFRETEINGRVIRPLVEWGRLIGVGDPEPASRAEHTITVTVTNQTGELSAGSSVLFPSTGVVYVTTATVELNDATVPVTIRASSDPSGNGGAGAIGNLNPGDFVEFASPLPNIARRAVVAAQTVTGADGETEAEYRAKIIRRFQARPQGGAYADYRIWGEGLAGILNVYPYKGSPGEVDVYVEATVASSGDPDGIPTLAQRAAVLAAINLDDEGLASRRPVNDAVNVYPITRTAFDVEITGLDADDVPAAKTAMEEAMDDHLRSREPFIVGLSVLPRKDRVTLAAVSGAADEAASAIGATITSVVLKLSGTPTPAYTLTDGEKSKLGTVTYV